MAETPKTRNRTIRYGDSLPTPSVAPYQADFAYVLAELHSNSVAFVVRAAIDALIRSMPDDQYREVLQNVSPQTRALIEQARAATFETSVEMNRINVTRRARGRGVTLE